MAFCHVQLKDGCCVVHRDFNPSNVGFRGDGTAVLFDFGNAKILEKYNAVSDELPREVSTSDITKLRAKEGTFKYEIMLTKQASQMTGEVGRVRYQAPEVSCYSPYGAQSDVFR